MTIDVNNILDKAIESIKDVFSENLLSIVLYGSYARGSFDSESDIDIMAIIDLPANEITKHYETFDRLASKLSLENENCITVCISLQDSETFYKYCNVLPFFSNIIAEGVTLYAS